MLSDNLNDCLPQLTTMDSRALTTLIYLYVTFLSLLLMSEYVGHVSSNDLMDQIQKLKDKILKNYDKHIRPMNNNTNTTIVITDFMPRQIISLDEERSILTLDGILYLGWDDARLHWDSSEYNGFLPLPKDYLWVPDIAIFNSHSMQVDPTHDVLLVIIPEGRVGWLPPVMTQTACAPPSSGDTVTCVILFGSWIHDGMNVDLYHSDKVYTNLFEDIHPRWKLKSSNVKRNVTRYGDDSQNDNFVVFIQLELVLERRPAPEIEATRAPCIMVMLLALVIFWLPSDACALKVLIGGILFLVLNLLLVYVALSTKYPLGVIFSVSFIRTIMYLVAATLLLQVFVVIRVCSLTGPSRPPPALMLLLKGPLGRYAFLRSPLPPQDSLEDRLVGKEDAAGGDSPRDEWLLVATAIDRLLFLVMAVAMVAVHHL